MKKDTAVLKWTKVALTSIALVFLTLLLYGILRAHHKRMQPYMPMISEAKALNLDFDTATANPEKYIDKPAIWCVQNLAKGQTYYRGDTRRPIYVFNHQQMPIFTGYKHTSCTDMLLQIKGVRASGTDPGSVGVMFVKEIN
jgi:hypothetical protein